MASPQPEIPSDVIHITVDPSAKVINSQAFYDFGQSKKVDLGEVRLDHIGIGWNAFDGCTCLKRIALPSTVREPAPSVAAQVY
mmetsp:Transcript_5480/g.10001  ORF Transcript_5480/g.10001 Transcript_5480/m.10001 type:complete len:83 (+) Transcript_5480:195-443(+)